MKATTIFSALLLTLSVLSTSGQQPVEYPCAQPEQAGSETNFLSKDDFQKVKDFYTKRYGEPTVEKELYPSGREATFIYSTSDFGPKNIQIIERGGESETVNKVLKELKSLEERGLLSKIQYLEIENKYSHLTHCYFLEEEDDMIFSSFLEILGSASEELMQLAEMKKEAEELIEAGQVAEGRAHLDAIDERANRSSSATNGPEIVTSWIECLEELREVKFPVLIIINR